MFEIIMLLIACSISLLFFLPFVAVGISIFNGLFRKSDLDFPDLHSFTVNQLVEDSREDSDGDGLLLFDDPMFPPELDND